MILLMRKRLPPFESSIFFSKIWFTIVLPMLNNSENVSESSSSSVSDLTLDTWTPSPRCLPEHSMHRTAPKLMLTHVGSDPPQSQQFPFPGTVVSWKCLLVRSLPLWQLFKDLVSFVDFRLFADLLRLKDSFVWSVLELFGELPFNKK